MATQKLGPLERCVRRVFGRNCSKLDLAERIVAAQNETTAAKWILEDVLGIALFNGLEEMERRYCKPPEEKITNVAK